MANHPIFKPTFHGELERVRELLVADPNIVSVRDAKNLTPLHVAASRDQSKVARLLLEHGADVEGPSEGDQWTPLVFAAYRGHLEAARVLLAFGAGVTEADGNPIHFAGQRRHKALCQLLVHHGAIDDLLPPHDPEVTALFKAAYAFDSTKVADLLAKHPSLVHATDRHGRTALLEDCTFGDTKTVRALLRHGADIASPDHHGNLPVDRAIVHRQHSVVKLLKEHAAKP